MSKLQVMQLIRMKMRLVNQPLTKMAGDCIRRFFVLAAAASAFVLVAPARAINPVGQSQENQDYFDLANNTDHFLAVGRFLSGGALCSSTWLGGEYVLTARHCGGSDESINITFNNGESVNSVGHWASEVPFNNNDIAIVRLERTPNLPTNYVAGQVRNSVSGIVGETGTLVGYGGIGRSAGHNTITGASEFGEIQAIRSNATSFQLGANLIPGDSGGPLFVEEPNGSFSIVGVAAVLFNQFDIWSNATAYSDQIEFGMETNNWGFFQQQIAPPSVGDLTLDGRIDISDINAFVANWNVVHDEADVDAWTKGDLNGDLITDLKDAFVLHNALRPDGGVLLIDRLGAARNIVSEPASVRLLTVLLAIIGVGIRSLGARF